MTRIVLEIELKQKKNEYNGKNPIFGYLDHF